MNHSYRLGKCFCLSFWVVLLALSPFMLAQENGQWLSAGQNRNNTRNAATESKISPANAGNLAVKWVFETGGDVSATPAVDGGHVYVPDWAGNIFKIDAATGAQVWRRQVSEFTGQDFNISRTTPLIAGNLVIFGTQLGNPAGIGATMIALNKNSGELVWKTQIDNHFASIVTQSAVAFGNTVYVGVASLEEAFAIDPNYPCCSFRGSVVALNKNTGAIIWKTYTVPDPATGFSGNAVWGSTPVVDPKRGNVYVTTGNNYTAPDDVLACVAAGGTPEEVKACIESVAGSSDNHFDAIMALDMNTGAIKWSQNVIPFDAWTAACFFIDENCPDPQGPDYDFGQGPALFTVKINGKYHDLLGAGQKSGKYWVLDLDDNNELLWETQVGPGGELGGLQWGSATDGNRIYTAVSNSNFQPHILPNGTTVYGGSWAALSAQSGEILWQTAATNPPPFPGPFTPPGAVATNQGAVTVANGVVFAGAVDAPGTMYAFDAATGQILWSFASGGSVNSGAAVVNGTVYWGSGYSNFFIGTPNNKLYAFSVPGLGKDDTGNSGSPVELTPETYHLGQNYPNPFNPVTMIEFSLPQSGNVTLNVFDVSGRFVKSLASGNFTAGTHAFQWDATDEHGVKVPSGVYLYRLNAGGFAQTGKMILLK